MRRQQTKVPYPQQVVNALVKNSWEPMHLLMVKNELAELIDSRTQENMSKIAGKIPPEPFSLIRKIIGDNVDGRYLLHFTYPNEAKEPALTKFSVHSGKTEVDIPITSLNDIPRQSAFVLARKTAQHQSREIGQEASQQKKL